MKNLLILFVFITFLSSCTVKKEDPIGKWDDIIQLSTKNIEFGAKADSAIITTKGDWWWIYCIRVNDTSYSFYNSEDIDLESDTYSIKQDYFIVERRDKNTLFIKLDDNQTENERQVMINLEAGDYFDYITIKQAAE